MPRRIGDLEVATTDRDAFAASQRHDRVNGHGPNFSPQPVHVVAVEALGTRQQLCRIDHVRGTLLVHIHAQTPVLVQEVGATGAGQLGVRDRLLDFVSVVVDGLPRAAGLLGLLKLATPPLRPA